VENKKFPAKFPADFLNLSQMVISRSAAKLYSNIYKFPVNSLLGGGIRGFWAESRDFRSSVTKFPANFPVLFRSREFWIEK